MTGTVVVAADADARLERLEQVLKSVLGAELPAPTVGGQSAASRVATLLAFAHGEAQRQCRIPVSERFAVLPTGNPRQFEIVLPCVSPGATALTLKWAITQFLRLGAGDASLQDSLQTLREPLKPFESQGVNTLHIVLAADRLDLPLAWVSPGVAVLGTGVHSRILQSSFTDATSIIGGMLAKQKDLTSRLLRAAGLPGGENELVGSADQAVAAATTLGYPVVVKPADLDRGIGVAADLRDAQAVRAAFHDARKESARILVERWAAGFTHRLTVFNGKVIRVVKRVAGGVVGDGVHDIAALLQQARELPQLVRTRRRLGRELLELDDEALSLLGQQGLTPQSVPPPGHVVRVRRRDNVNAGGHNELIPLGDVHPDNVALAIDAARLLILDFAGVDLIIEDIASSWLETGGLVCEVNSQPQLGVSSEPHVYENVIGELLGPQACVPARLLLCPAKGSARASIREACVRAGGGVSAPEGLWLDGRRATMAFPSGHHAAAALLRRKDVTRAVCLVTPHDVSSNGLPVHRWDAIEFAPDSAFTGEELKALKWMRQWLPGHLRPATSAN